MKTHSIILTIVFLSASLFAAGQNISTQSPVSKEVQKIANKNAFINEHPLTIASLGYPAWLISKDVHPGARRLYQVVPGNLVSVGYPAWIISKRVHRAVPRVKENEAAPRPVVKDVIANL